MGTPRRVVHGAFRRSLAPVTTEETVSPDDAWTLFCLFIWRLFANYKFEWLLFGTPILLWITLDRYGDDVANLATALLIVVVLALRVPRQFVGRHLRKSRFNRRWQTVARFAGLANHNDHVPKLVKLEGTPAGERITVRIPFGSAPAVLEGNAERLATCFSAREVRVTRDPTNARFASIDVVRTDPLADPKPLIWPHIQAESLSVWDPIPVGVNEFGEVGNITLPERNVLLGGEPGAGKSVALSQLVATAALDPACDLTLLDGKQVELAAWSKSASCIVGPSIAEACDALRVLQSDMNERYGRLLDQGQRKISPNDGQKLHVVVCDELAFYLTMGDRKECQEFERLARDLVARGRAAGVIVLAATQRPSHDIVPTSLRDLFAFRWSLRCTTPQASDTILGQGWASQAFSSHTIDAANRGVGYLRHEGAEPVRLKSFCLTDSDIEALGRRAAGLRHAA